MGAVIVGQDALIAASGRASGRRAPPPGGGARSGQDPRRQDACADAERQVLAAPVHARPSSGRPDRDPDLQPQDRRVRHAQGADLRHPHPRGRDQPGARQGAERAPRGDAGTAGHHRGVEPPAAGPVPRSGDPEPDRAGRDLPAPRGAARPVHAQGQGRLPVPRGGEGNPRADVGGAPAGDSGRGLPR